MILASSAASPIVRPATFTGCRASFAVNLTPDIPGTNRRSGLLAASASNRSSGVASSLDVACAVSSSSCIRASALVAALTCRPPRCRVR